MVCAGGKHHQKWSLPVRGAWIEMLNARPFVIYGAPSLPVRGAWIEMRSLLRYENNTNVSLPVRGAWIEIRKKTLHTKISWSLPVRGAWIEIATTLRAVESGTSLPVRGAWIEITLWIFRSALPISRSPCGERGLKFSSVVPICAFARSLPVRGAWIEILYSATSFSTSSVAPRAGSVD